MAKAVIWILINLGVILLLGIQFLWLFSQFIDRNLSDDHGEIDNIRITNLTVLVLRGGNMSLVGKHKSSLHTVVALLVLLDALFLILFIFFACLLWGLDLLQKVIVSRKQPLSVDFTYLTQRNVWNFVFKTSVDVDTVARCPARVSESLD